MFTETAPGTWSPRGSLTDRLLPTDDGFVLLRKNSFRYFFRRHSSGGKDYYLMDEIQDDVGNAYSIEYNLRRQVSKVTEPAGRFFRISYQMLTGNKMNLATLATLSAAPAPGAWTEMTVTNPKAFRYVQVLQADKSYGNIAEVEFYDADTGEKLTGSVICSDSLTAGQSAFDGNPSTGFVSGAQSGGYVGLDLGEPKKIGKVRFLSVAGKEAVHDPGGWNFAPLRVQGGNEAPLSLLAISKVETSDGRSVNYEYTPFEDSTLPYVFPVLSTVSYGDGTQAEYKHTQVFPGTRPFVSEWDDVRYELRQSKYKTVYQNSRTAVLGWVESQVNLETGGTILEIGLAGSLHKPKVTYANGGSEINIYATNLPGGASIVQAIDQNGHPTSYTYGEDGYMATQTDALGRVTSYTWTPQGNPLTQTYPDGSVKSSTYNDLNALVSHADTLGRVTTYTRDELNRVTRVDYPDATFETFAFNDFGQVTSQRFRNGGVATFDYNAKGLLIRKVDALGKATRYAYDSASRLNSVTDALGRVTTVEYNERGLVTRVANPDGTTKSYTYSKYGDVLTETNELGNTWTYTYDVFRRVTSIADPLGRITRTTYQPDSYTKKPLSITSPSGNTASFTYDPAWNLQSTTDGTGATTSYAYDPVDNVVSVTDPMGKAASATYDTRDRKLTSTDPLGHVISWTYDVVGNVLTATRPDGGVTTHVYDTMNRVVQTTDPKGQTTAMTYDASGNPSTMTDPKGSVYAWSYDLLDRPTAMVYPGGASEQYGYDAVSNLTRYTTRAGQVRTSVFNTRNQEIQTNWGTGAPDIARTFDALGRVLTEDNGVAQLSYTYDVANQITSETTTVTGQSARTVAYSYDADGRRATATYPGGNAVSYSYTPRGQVDSIALDGGSLVGYEYNAVGNRTAKNLENGIGALFTYDDAHRLTGIEHRKGLDLLAGFAYTLDSVGNRKSKTGGLAAVPTVESYAYDAVDQIIEAKYGAVRTVAYTYDAAGNRQAVTDNGSTKTYTVNALNQYTREGGGVVSHGENGNLTRRPGASYGYDAQNRLTHATVGGVTTTFAYDPRNRVVQRTVGGVTTNLTYDGWNLIEERDGSGALQQVYVHGAGVDEMLAKVTTAGAVYCIADGLGSTVALADESGTLVESYTYDVFGAATIRDGSGAPLAQSAFGNRFLFTGREWLKEAAIYDYRNRVYSPDLGRFLQTDPIRFSAGDANIYRYCGNSSANFVDPFGLDDDDDGDGHVILIGEPGDILSSVPVTPMVGPFHKTPIRSYMDPGEGYDPNKNAIAGLAGEMIIEQFAVGTAMVSGLGNPFKGKTAGQIDKMFMAKGFNSRGPDALSGKGGYINPQNGRSYHIDEANSFGEASHVDINRLKTYDGTLGKKKYFTGE